MPRMRFGLVGCGRISKNHIEAFAALHDDIELAAVCDIDRSRAEAAGAKGGCSRIYTSIDAMLAEGGLDAVSICTPSGLHPELGIIAARKGVHVVSEKPLGVRLGDIDRLIKVCDECGVMLFCVKQNRLNSTMRLLKAAVDKGRFGKIYLAQVNVFWQRPQSYYDAASWRGTWAMDGGAFLNQASHYVDSLYWLLGEVKSVCAITSTLGRNIESEDTGCAALSFASGALGNINVTMLAYPHNIEGSVTILGEKGSVKVGGVAINHIDRWEFADYDDDDKLVTESNYNPPNVYGYGHLGYYRNVVQALRGEASPGTDGRQGRKSVEIILGIYQSAREGRLVNLPLSE